MITISVDSDEEEAAIRAAHEDDTLGVGEFDYVIRRGHRTLCGRSKATVTYGAGAGSLMASDGAGGCGTASVEVHQHGLTDPCLPDCSSFEPMRTTPWYRPDGGPSWVERYGHPPDEPCPPTCRGNPARPR